MRAIIRPISGISARLAIMNISPHFAARTLSHRLQAVEFKEIDSETGLAPSETSPARFASTPRKLSGATQRASIDMDDLLRSVVKIFCTSLESNFQLAWQTRKQTTSTSSGFIIAGRRVVTNAHGISNATSIRIRKHGSAHKYAAKVLHVAHECDLALLEVDDEEFWVNLKPMEISDEVPALHSELEVIGFPTGGDNLSVSKGVLSRVEVLNYVHSGESFVCLQSDSAINNGNSGGCAVQNGVVIGVAFEVLKEASGIGYIIPASILKRVLNDLERHGRLTGFPRIGITWSKMENSSLKRFFKLPPNQTGILVTSVEPLDKCFGLIHPGDVIVSIDDKPVADDGTVSLRGNERVLFRHTEVSESV